MPKYYTMQNSQISVAVPGILSGDFTAWDSMEGGDNTAATTVYMPGGMGPTKAMPAIPVRSPMTVKRVWTDFLFGLFIALDNATGRIDGCSMTYQMLDSSARIVPNQYVTYTGLLKTTTRPNYEAKTPEVAYLTLVFELDGPVTGGLA